MKRNKITNPAIRAAGIALTVIATLVTSSISHAAVADINDLNAAKGGTKLYKRMSDKDRKAMRGGQKPEPSPSAKVKESESIPAPSDKVTRHTETADSSNVQDEQESEKQHLKDLEDEKKRKEEELEKQRLKDLEDEKKRKEEEQEKQRLKDLEDEKKRQDESIDTDDDDVVVTEEDDDEVVTEEQPTETTEETTVDEFVISEELLHEIRKQFKGGRKGVATLGRSDDYLTKLAQAFRTIYNRLEDKGVVPRQENDGDLIGYALPDFVPHEKRNSQGEVIPSAFVNYPMVRGVFAENTDVAALSMMVKVETYQRPEGYWKTKLTSCTPEALQITMVNNNASASGWATYVDPHGSNTEKVKECLNIPGTVFMGEGENVQAIGGHHPYMVETIILMVMTGEAQNDYYRMILASASEQDDAKTAKLMQELVSKPAATKIGKQITEADFSLVR